MTLPRPVFPGETVLLTRRCTQRQFLLRPCAVVNAIIGYCLAVAAKRYGIEIHAFCVMSNHLHIVLTDPRGTRPEFCRWFFEFTAKCLNAHWGRWENLWASEPPSVVRLSDAVSQVAKAVYTITNAVAANLVTEHHHWPGLVSAVARWHKPLRVTRPKGYFSDEGPLPKHEELTLTPLPALAHLAPQAYVEQLSAAVTTREAELAQQRRQQGLGVLGRRQVLRQSAFDTPSRSEPRRELNPRIAGGSKWARIEALERLREFLNHYRAAWTKWRSGTRTVVFPYGTYALCHYAGVLTAQPP